MKGEPPALPQMYILFNKYQRTTVAGRPPTPSGFVALPPAFFSNEGWKDVKTETTTELEFVCIGTAAEVRRIIVNQPKRDWVLYRGEPLELKSAVFVKVNGESLAKLP